LIDHWQSGLGYSYPQPQHWSQDNRFFYFFERWVADGDCELFPLNESWQRFSVETGQVSVYQLPLGRGHALSPDDRTLAYISVEPPLRAILLDRKANQQQELPLPTPAITNGHPKAGNILWSPNGNALVLVIASGDLCDSPGPVFTLVRIDLLEQKALEFNDRWFGDDPPSTMGIAQSYLAV